MNKYQDALDELSYPLIDSSCGGCKCGESDCQDCKKAQAVFKLQELVDRATPKKPAFDKTWEDEETKDIYNEDDSINENVCKCPNCHKRSIYDFEYGTRFNHCYECGQRILWEE